VLVHPEDKWLLCKRYIEKLHAVDIVLPFGLIKHQMYNVAVNTLLWLLKQERVDSLHPLELLLAAGPDSDKRTLGLRSNDWCGRLGKTNCNQQNGGPSDKSNISRD